MNTEGTWENKKIFKKMWNRMRRQITFNTKIEVIHNKILPQYVEFETPTLKDSWTFWFSSLASHYFYMCSTLVIPFQKSLQINCLCPESVPNRFSFTIIYKRSTSMNDFTSATVQIYIISSVSKVLDQYILVKTLKQLTPGFHIIMKTKMLHH